MFFRRNNGKPQGPIYDWLLENKNRVLEGNAEYNGTSVSETTRFFQYKYTVSLFVITLDYTTEHYLPTAANEYLRFTSWKYSLISAVLGWWCFPWGPFFTVSSLFVNASGGRQRTAGSLLQLLEWGWDAPSDVSAIAHDKRLLELSDQAAEEIKSRIVGGDFPENVGVRITPTKWADSEVEITFDYPVSDGRDWIDHSQGLTLLIDKNHEAELSGSEIDVENGKFYFKPC